MNQKYRKYLIIVFISFTIFPSVQLSAQDTDNIEDQVWIDWVSYRLPRENIQFMGDAGMRFLIGGGWRKYLVRPSLQLGINDWLDLFGGLGFFYTVQDSVSNTLEIRPWIGARLYWYWDTFSKIRFTNYTRVEDRFVIDTQDGGTSNSVRFRNKIDARIPITDHYFGDQIFYLMASFEFFLEAGEVDELFPDDIRVGGGLGYKFNYNWRIESYLYFFLSKDSAGSNYSRTDRVWRLTLKHFID